MHRTLTRISYLPCALPLPAPALPPCVQRAEFDERLDQVLLAASKLNVAERVYLTLAEPGVSRVARCARAGPCRVFLPGPSLAKPVPPS